MDRKTIDLWVGVFVIMGFIALLMLAFKVGNLGTDRVANTYLLKANFDNIGGLKLKAPVKSAGVIVGRVTDIYFDNMTYKAVVSLTMDQHYNFPTDTTASILTSGLLGEVYIGLDAGGEDKKLKTGERIKITQSAVVLEQLIGQMLFDKASDTSARNSGSEKAGEKK